MHAAREAAPLPDVATDAGRLALTQYAPRVRAERLITSGRLVLAIFSLLAVRLEAAGPVARVDVTDALLAGYAVYALGLAVLAWLAPAPRARLGLVTHALDLVLFTALMYLTEGPATPFFGYFVFVIVGATLRWQWRGALWTAAVVFATFNAIGLYQARVVRSPAFDVDRFVIRSVSLVVMAGLLAFLGLYEERRRRDMARLAAWPRSLHERPAAALREILESAGRALDAPRVLLAWEDANEPWLQLALWGGPGEFRSWREPPTAFPFLVAEPLAHADFLCEDVRARLPLVLRAAPTGVEEWLGAPLHAELQARFAVTAVLSLRLAGQCFEGRLLALDRRSLTADDLVLGDVVARQVAASLDHVLMSERLREAAAVEERARVFRDLHDGVLQSLAGAALQLETVRWLLGTQPEVARERLADVQRLIAKEQRALRLFIGDSKVTPLAPLGSEGALGARLDELLRRLEELWGVRAQLELGPLEGAPLDSLADDACRMVQEAVVNAARHGGATRVRVSAAVRDGHLILTVSDNGRGFAFRGRLNHGALTALRLGPVMLKQRVQALGGTLAIESSGEGARLEIELPCTGGGSSGSGGNGA